MVHRRLANVAAGICPPFDSHKGYGHFQRKADNSMTGLVVRYG
jgi:hypothetical protein